MERDAQIRQTACEWLRYNHPTCTQDMLVEAFRCGAGWADAHQPSPWISVEEQLPEDFLLTCEWVAVKLKGYPGWYKGYYNGALWHYINECGDEVRTFNVTHWMPIPGLQTTNN